MVKSVKPENRGQTHYQTFPMAFHLSTDQLPAKRYAQARGQQTLAQEEQTTQEKWRQNKTL
jgi:hypothetical protein